MAGDLCSSLHFNLLLFCGELSVQLGLCLTAYNLIVSLTKLKILNYEIFCLMGLALHGNKSSLVIDREIYSALVIDREIYSALVIDREIYSALIIQRQTELQGLRGGLLPDMQYARPLVSGICPDAHEQTLSYGSNSTTALWSPSG